METIRNVVVHTLDEHKAQDIVSIDLAGKSSFADHMVIASGTSQRHLSALASHIVDMLRERDIPVLSVEGKENADWVLIDAGDVIVHLFKPESRQFYNLEKMWSVTLPALEAAQ